VQIVSAITPKFSHFGLGKNKKAAGIITSTGPVSIRKGGLFGGPSKYR
jgi:hypothetical protein